MRRPFCSSAEQRRKLSAASIGESLWLPYTEQGKNRLKNLPPHGTASQTASYLSAVRPGGLAAVPGKNDDPPAPTRLWGGLTQKGAVRG